MLSKEAQRELRFIRDESLRDWAEQKMEQLAPGRQALETVKTLLDGEAANLDDDLFESWQIDLSNAIECKLSLLDCHIELTMGSKYEWVGTIWNHCNVLVDENMYCLEWAILNRRIVAVLSRMESDRIEYIACRDNFERTYEFIEAIDGAIDKIWLAA